MTTDEKKPLGGGRMIPAAEVQALLDRSLVGLLFAAQLGRPNAYLMRRGTIDALQTLLRPPGCVNLAALDAKALGYEPPAYYKAAVAAFPFRGERLSMAEMQQFLLAHGVEITPDPIHDQKV